MSPRFSIILVIWAAYLMGGASSNIGINNLSEKTPILIVLAPRAYIDQHQQAFEVMVDEDELLDLKLKVIKIAEDESINKIIGTKVRSQFGIIENKELDMVWLLLGRDGRMLANGNEVPSAELLCQSLASAGEQSQVTILRAYLKSHPEHEEARTDLIRALRPGVERRLRRRFEVKRTELSDQEDKRIWGDIALELDALLQNEAWSGLYVTLDELLPSGAPEASSQLIKAVYRRNRAQLLQGLERYPECIPLLRNLLRMNEVLGDQDLLSILDKHPIFQSPTNAVSLIPYGPLANRVQSEAIRTGNWSGAAETLDRIWRLVARPRLLYYDRAWIASTRFDGKKVDLSQFSRMERDEVWYSLLVPLISAEIKAGLESKIPILLTTLDESWSALNLELRLKSLASSQGRVDLSPTWIASVQSLAARTPREGMLGTELRVFYEGQPDLNERLTWMKCLPFRKDGISIDIWPVPLSWQKHLGWSNSDPRWAMVNADGQVILHGRELPSGERLLELFRDLHNPTALERTNEFLYEHPDHLVPLIFKAEVLTSIIHAMQFNQDCIRALNKKDLCEEGEIARSELRALFRRIINDPLSTCPSLLERYALTFPKRMLNSGESDPEDQNLARGMMVRLEDSLSRWPNQPILWQAWSVFASYRVDSPIAFLASLHPSPTRQNDPWPSKEILAIVGENLRSLDRWQDLADLLQPWVLGELGMARNRANYHGSFGELSSYAVSSGKLKDLLLEAYIHLGRDKDADKLRGL